MLHIFAMFLALLFPASHHHVHVFDVIGGGGPGVVAPTPAPIVAPADVIGGGGPG